MELSKGSDAAEVESRHLAQKYHRALDLLDEFVKGFRSRPYYVAQNKGDATPLRGEIIELSLRFCVGASHTVRTRTLFIIPPCKVPPLTKFTDTPYPDRLTKYGIRFALPDLQKLQLKAPYCHGRERVKARPRAVQNAEGFGDTRRFYHHDIHDRYNCNAGFGCYS